MLPRELLLEIIAALFHARTGAPAPRTTGGRVLATSKAIGANAAERAVCWQAAAHLFLRPVQDLLAQPAILALEALGALLDVDS